jgi:hypothetical protein
MLFSNFSINTLRTQEWRQRLSESNKGKYFGKRGIGCRKKVVGVKT